MPLNIAYLASYLRQGIECEISILDAEIMGLSYKEIKKFIEREKPEVVGITCPSPTMDHVLKICEIIKKEINANCITVVGGIHPTVLPYETIKNPFIDFLVAGEGEITFYELIKALKEKNDDFAEIDGLYFKQNNKIVANKPRQLIVDLDTIPFPARDLFNLELYYSAPTKKVSNERAGPLLTARGCAFNCTHCISHRMWGRNPRFRSVQNIVAEMEECINRFGIREFNMIDDTFTLNEKRAMEICEEIIGRKWNISWVAMTRVNAISEKLAEKMKEAGCKKVLFGLESGSQKVLDLMRKQATIEMARKAVEMVNKQKMLVQASFMIGNVGETEETIQETIEFAKSLPLDNATFFITSPYPGTDLYEVAKEQGFITKDTKWGEYAPLTNTPPIPVQKNIPKERLVYWQKRAFREFHLRPKYIIRKLKQLKSLDSLKTILEGLRILYRILMLK